MLRMDHRYNNPILIVFGGILLDLLARSRATQQLRRIRLQWREIKHGDGASGLRRVRFCRWALSVLDENADQQLALSLRARNRWQLAWRLQQQAALLEARQQSQMRQALKERLQRDGRDTEEGDGPKVK